MSNEGSHISDHDLILASDGELPEHWAEEIQAHLDTCFTCRARRKEVEGGIANVVRVYRDGLDPDIPPYSGPHALFRVRLSQLAGKHQQAISDRFVRHRAVYVLGTFVLALVALVLWPSSQPTLAWSPNPQLTPGLTLPLTEADVCRKPPMDRAHSVLASVGKKVFEQYGIRNPEPRHYEMDYLIDPDLGGAEDARNLWPQPYSSLWNANAKDALEDHLRELVCTGRITLAQAQHDISTDWIFAYKRYFHTEQPLPIHQAFRKDQPWE